MLGVFTHPGMCWATVWATNRRKRKEKRMIYRFIGGPENGYRRDFPANQQTWRFPLPVPVDPQGRTFDVFQSIEYRMERWRHEWEIAGSDDEYASAPGVQLVYTERWFDELFAWSTFNTWQEFVAAIGDMMFYDIRHMGEPVAPPMLRVTGRERFRFAVKVTCPVQLKDTDR